MVVSFHISSTFIRKRILPVVYHFQVSEQLLCSVFNSSKPSRRIYGASLLVHILSQYILSLGAASKTVKSFAVYKYLRALTTKVRSALDKSYLNEFTT